MERPSFNGGRDDERWRLDFFNSRERKKEKGSRPGCARLDAGTTSNHRAALASRRIFPGIKSTENELTYSNRRTSGAGDSHLVVCQFQHQCPGHRLYLRLWPSCGAGSGGTNRHGAKRGQVPGHERFRRQHRLLCRIAAWRATARVRNRADTVQCRINAGAALVARCGRHQRTIASVLRQPGE